MALKASPAAGLFPPLRPTASSSPSTSNRPCSLRVLPLRPSFFGNSSASPSSLIRLGFCFLIV
ncbi:predicted protein [Arabidopsis lyrata subsp. lyrata]|uniref:Predicted protein n=1 Tax=Arabidopsis lyrata subsp. lyrata TaxID=81972 RepID=D7KRT2_ARALL|nr:predicted protein [Arabidopsis lyrata subsp. lyrata]